jgi:alpha-tubulin suppressor-like RCC1 family protein
VQINLLRVSEFLPLAARSSTGPTDAVISRTFLMLGSGTPGRRLRQGVLIPVAPIILGVAQISCSDNPLGPNDVASVEIGGTKKTMALGDTTYFYALLKNKSGDQLFDRNVRWTSSNANVASISPFAPEHDPTSLLSARLVITGVGESIVTATSEGKSASITIVAFRYHAVFTGIEPQNPIIAIGDKFAWNVTVLDTQGNPFPEKLAWRSDNPSVVTVDDGRLSARSVGSAYIALGFDEPLSPSQYVQVVQQVPIGTITSLTSNYRTGCTVNNAGAAFCWGDGTEGQLANGDFGLYPPVGVGKSAMIPVPIPGGITFSAISPSVFHTCGLSTTGAAYCWGRNSAGELGEGRTDPQKVRPMPVLGGHTFVTLGTGSHYTCGLDDAGAAYCWGNNAYPDFSYAGSFVTSYVPVAVPGGLVFASLSAGFKHVCGITTDGATYCWGRNASGELGDGSTADHATPVLVGGGVSFVQVSAGERATCGLTSAGEADCWGANSAGQLGDGTKTSHAVPAPVASNLVFKSISLGNDHACAVETSGAVSCWGDNTQGALGNGTKVSSSVPAAVSGNLHFSSVHVGLGSTCGLTTNQVAYCWGRNNFGQLGNGTGAQSSVPVKVEGQP